MIDDIPKKICPSCLNKFYIGNFIIEAHEGEVELDVCVTCDMKRDKISNKMSKDIELLKRDLDATNYILINVEPSCNWRETKGISFNTKEECDIIRKHIINALIELGDITTENNT